MQRALLKMDRARRALTIDFAVTQATRDLFRKANDDFERVVGDLRRFRSNKAFRAHYDRGYVSPKTWLICACSDIEQAMYRACDERNGIWDIEHFNRVKKVFGDFKAAEDEFFAMMRRQ